jgi:hypothetical protein
MATVLMGSGLLRSGLAERNLSTRLRTMGVKATGSVVSVDIVKIAGGNQGDDSYYDEPTVRFREDGRDYAVRVHASRGDLHFTIGQPLEVVYLAGRPGDTRLSSQLDLNWQSLTGALTIFAGLALAATFAGFGRR